MSSSLAKLNCPPCSICLDSYNTPEDRLAFCSHCHLIVHQSCYGGEILEAFPESSWICENCSRSLRFPNVPTTCKFCSQSKGTLKKFQVEGLPGKIWAHVQCVSWIPELTFDSEELQDKTTYQYVMRYRTGKECTSSGKSEGATIKVCMRFYF